MVVALIQGERQGLTLDTRHHLASGTDLAALLRTFPQRLHHVHLKDQRGTTPTRMGAGDVDVDLAFRLLSGLGYAGCASIGLEMAQPFDPVEELRLARDWVDCQAAPSS